MEFVMGSFSLSKLFMFSCISLFYCGFSCQASARDLANPTREQIIALHSFLSGQQVDFESQARQSDVVRRASEFDRQMAQRREVERLRSEFLRFSEVQTITMNIQSVFSEYDSNAGGFVLDLFEAGRSVSFLPVSVVFDNREEFRVWRMDVPMARQLLARTQNRRDIIVEVQATPFAAGTSGRPEIRTQVRRIRILEQGGRGTLAELASSQPQRRMIAPGQAQTPGLNEGLFNVMGLALGQDFAQFERWARTNQMEVVEAFPAMNLGARINFAAPQRAARMREEQRAAGFNIQPTPFPTRSGFQPPLRVFGQNLDCASSVNSQQICGQVYFSAGMTPAERKAQSIVLLQSVLNSDTQTVISQLIQRFGPIVDQFSVQFGDISGRHLTWGPSFAPAPSRILADRLGAQGQNWAVEAFVFQPESNRVALVVQINGNHGVQTGGGGTSTGPAGSPRL